jgi:hypothetical protein
MEGGAVFGLVHELTKGSNVPTVRIHFKVLEKGQLKSVARAQNFSGRKNDYFPSCSNKL